MLDFKPTGTPEPPLSKATEWVRYTEQARRETNTMPQWAGSCWYYLRYCDARNTQRFVGREAERYWMTGAAEKADRPSSDDAEKLELNTLASGGAASQMATPAGVHPGGVDLYVGGTEHAVLHLLYARFWHKVLFDLGYVSTPEPFQKLVNQGIILGEDGQKMSKSRGNVVNPDDVIGTYGADAFRCFEMFMGPLEQMKPWSTTGVEGLSRFLARVWRLAMEENQAGEWVPGRIAADSEPDKASLKVIHATVKKVSEDIEALSYNTALAQMMVFVNHFTPITPRPASAVRVLLQLLNPFAPHPLEGALERLGFRAKASTSPWLPNEPWPLLRSSTSRRG